MVGLFGADLLDWFIQQYNDKSANANYQSIVTKHNYHYKSIINK